MKSESQAFFERHYSMLRQPHAPMEWMKRMFSELITGQVPSVVDLPTGAGKTDVSVIWLIALAWYAKNRDSAHPIPRRLVWVVNRRVLVQQVDDMAQHLESTLAALDCEMATCLRGLCRDGTGSVFRSVQLRGQRLDDREWTLDPTIPQLIIGTVDQIGSRLLFQGYGLGRWSRPHHAGLLGVDAWVCVDEAHLVPAFVATLRQVHEIATRPVLDHVPDCVGVLFAKLPFWVSELSATPGLPRPKRGSVFTLETDKDRTGEVMKARLRAREKRRVLWESLPRGKTLSAALSEKALGLEVVKRNGTVAIFCRFPKDADTVAKEIGRKHKDRVLHVTGRIRGYDRDLLARSRLFRRFRHASSVGEAKLPAFLVGTAAAEVGLDADADAIVCDFAPLPTLVQRLGRLDRIGRISKEITDSACEDLRPTMHIIGGENGRTTLETLEELTNGLAAKDDSHLEFSAALFSGSPWREVTEVEEGEEDNDGGAKKGKAKSGVDDAVLSATWKVLSPAASGETSPSKDWLSHRLAVATSGPVVVPPLTDAVLRRWAATTPPPPRFLPVHPWLYGLLPSTEGTPLVGIAFRLELDCLKDCAIDQEDQEDGDRANSATTWQSVRMILSEFPPLRSELHFIPINTAREWLKEYGHLALAHFNGDEWSNRVSASELAPNSILVLPTSTDPAVIEPLVLKNGDASEDRRCWDVFDALAQDGARYRREVTWECGFPAPPPESSVWRIPDIASAAAVVDRAKWTQYRRVLRYAKESIAFELRYFSPSRDDDAVSVPLDGHLCAVGDQGRRIASALSPGNAGLATVLGAAGQGHDIGKDHAKWQRGMGNTEYPHRKVAKAMVGNPERMGGYRHEWGSLWKTKDETGSELARHMIAAHHGWFRPSMPDKGFDCPPTPAKQNSERLAAIDRFARLQSQLGYWRLAYLEGLLKSADVAGSRDAHTPEDQQ